MEQIALVVITDGRYDYLHETLTSLNEKVDFKFDHRFIINDEGTDNSKAYLKAEYGEQYTIIHHPNRSGLTQAVRYAWTAALEAEVDYVFHLEEDFTFNEAVDVWCMKFILQQNPHLTQMLLKRQPWSAEEIAAGGYVDMDPDAYEDKEDGIHTWCEHRKFFSLNHCLIPRRVYEQMWHDDNERGFTAQLMADETNKSGIWGHKFDAPKVHHIGVRRTHGGGDHGYGIAHVPA